jgi:hypothetical protein
VLALLLATSTWHLEWSQQARHYTSIFLYSNLAIALYASSVRWPRPDWRWLALALGLVFLAVSSRATSLMIFGVIGLDLLLTSARERRLALPPVAIGAIAACGVACIALLAVRNLGPAGDISEQAAFIARETGGSPLKVVAGNALFSGLPVVVLAAAGFLAHVGREVRHAWLLAFVVAVPLVCFAGLAPFVHVEIRYTFVNHFGWLALAAIGVVALYDAARQALPPWVAVAPLAMALAGTGYAGLVYYESAYGNRPRWNHAFAYVGRNWQPGEALYAHSSWAGRYYLESDRVANVDLDFEGLDSLDRDTWFVVKATDWDRGEGRAHWLDGVAELRASYPTRTAFPQDTVRVYRYAHADAGASR